MSLVHVAVAVIVNENNQVLVAKRNSEQHQGDKWEFPGGKVAYGENSQEALCRECREELGIEIQSAVLMTDILHTYDDKTVLLDVYEVNNWVGEAEGREGQPICWVNKNELDGIDFPAANAEILTLLT